MAEYSESKLTVNWFGVRSDVFDISDWTNGQDLHSLKDEIKNKSSELDHRKRSKIVHAIIYNHSLDHLRTILGSGWNVDETLWIPDHELKNCWDYDYKQMAAGLLDVQYREITALQEAARQGWTEGVKMLLEAGAKCMTSNALYNILTLVIQKQDFPVNLIGLLLKHGADPNYYRTDKDIPLICAISKYTAYTVADYSTSNLPKIVQLLLEHGADPNVIGCVNEGTHRAQWVQRTAIHEAAWRGWTELVKMLLDAGAKCETSDALSNILTLALHNDKCPVDLIALLLKHGADPNPHDGSFYSIPLLQAITKCGENFTKSIQLLLEYGADPNVSGQKKMQYLSKHKHRFWSTPVHVPKDRYITRTALYVAARQLWTVDYVKMLLAAGAKYDVDVKGEVPLLHTLVVSNFCVVGMQQEHLDIFFQHGGNINMVDADRGTALEFTVGQRHQSNCIRWLIRHGADTSSICVTQTPMEFICESHLILLQAGVRISGRAKAKLIKVEMAISALLLGRSKIYTDPKKKFAHFVKVYKARKKITPMWDRLKEVEKKELQRKKHSFRKSTFSEYWTQQMADLQEFSDGSLQIYPEDNTANIYAGPWQKWQYKLDIVHLLLEFSSQIQLLQWYCRGCVRENLVSLQPSVVKTLPIPGRMKRYILCHEL